MLKVLAHKSHSGRYRMRLQVFDELAVIVVPAAHRILVLVEADNERGPRHQLAHEPPQNRIIGQLAQQNMESAGRADRIADAAGMTMRGFFLDVAA